MLYIINKDNSQKTWHVGESFNVNEGIQVFLNNVVEIQADGDELNFIVTNMVNLTYPKLRVVTWYGDVAKQITWLVWCRRYRSTKNA